jgi:predicted membrane protein
MMNTRQFAQVRVNGTEEAQVGGTGRIVLGIILVLLGVLYLLDIADVLNASSIVGSWWPVGIIIFGLVALLGPNRSVTGGGIMIAVGLILLIASTDLVDVSVGELIFPVILIAIGAGVLLMRSSRRAEGDPANTVNAFAMFGGNDTISRSESFQGGSLVAILGGTTLDLRHATIDPAGAGIDTFAAFGGIDVLVPRGWRVHVKGMPIFGAFEDKTDPSAPIAPNAPHLTISGVAAFGGVAVKHDK